MYSDFGNNLMLAMLSYKIINIYMDNGEKIIITDLAGLNGNEKDTISFHPFGFYIKEGTSAKWYSYAHIIKIEVFGYES